MSDNGDSAPADGVSTAVASPADVLATQWPRSEGGITTEWLSALLGAPVVSFTTTPITSGALSDMCTVTLTYGREGRPRSVVLKYANQMETAREMALGARAYSKECEFYSTLAAESPLQLVKVYGVWRERAKPDEWFCIAMADASADNDIFNCAKGVSVADAQDIVKIAARLHGKYFQSEALELDWLSGAGPDGTYHHFFATWAYGFFKDPAGSCVAAQRGMSEYAPPTVTSRNAFGADYPDCDEILDLLGGEKGVAIATAMRQRLTSRPYTLVHGDLRCDNVFKPKNGSRDFPIIDWQMCTAGPAAVDLVQALCMSLSDLADYAHTEHLVALYHQELVRCNPTAGDLYPLAACKEDFAISLAFAVCGITATIGPYCLGLKDDPSNAIWELANCMFLRVGACVTHSNVLTVVKSFAASV